MADEDQIIETVDENGNVIKFELFDIVEVDEQEYALLLPVEEEEGDEQTIVILSYNEQFNSFSELIRLFHHYEKNIEDENDSLGQYVKNQLKNVLNCILDKK